MMAVRPKAGAMAKIHTYDASVETGADATLAMPAWKLKKSVITISSWK